MNHDWFWRTAFRSSIINRTHQASQISVHASQTQCASYRPCSCFRIRSERFIPSWRSSAFFVPGNLRLQCHYIFRFFLVIIHLRRAQDPNLLIETQNNWYSRRTPKPTIPTKLMPNTQNFTKVPTLQRSTHANMSIYNSTFLNANSSEIYLSQSTSTYLISLWVLGGISWLIGSKTSFFWNPWKPLPKTLCWTRRETAFSTTKFAKYDSRLP